MDVKTAFLYGNLKEEINMNFREGYCKAGKVASLLKCMYGLKQSAREWYEILAALLRKLGFVTLHFDLCIFIHISETTFILIYVDDISIFAPPSEFRQDVKDALTSEFDCKDLSNVRYILGLEINYTDKGIELSHCGYIEKILLKYVMIDCHPVSIPLDPNSPLQKTAEPGTGIDNIHEYQSIIGSLMYAVIGTRPDLAHTVTVLSQFSSSPNEIHLQAAKCTL